MGLGENVKRIFERVFVDGFRGMTIGIFATLIIGTIVSQLGIWIGGSFGEYLTLFGYVAKSLTGFGIGISLATMYGQGPLVTICAGMAGLLGSFRMVSSISVGLAGETFGALIAAYIAITIGKLIAGKTNLDIVVIPFSSIIVGCLVGIFISPYITIAIRWLGGALNYNVETSPVIGGIVVASVMSIFAALPLNILSLTMVASLTGTAAGAATIGCCCTMVGFAVMSFRDNRIGGILAQGFGSALLQFPNLIRRPYIIAPCVITSAILGPVGTVLLKMEGTAKGAGTGALILIGQFETWNAMKGTLPSVIIIIEIVMMHFLLPGLFTFAISEAMRKLNWIKSSDMTIKC